MKPTFKRIEENLSYNEIFQYMKNNALTCWHSTATQFLIRVDKELNLIFTRQFFDCDVEFTPRNRILSYINYSYIFYEDLDVFVDEIQSILLANRLLDGLSVKNVKEKVRKI